MENRASKNYEKSRKARNEAHDDLIKKLNKNYLPLKKDHFPLKRRLDAYIGDDGILLTSEKIVRRKDFGELDNKLVWKMKVVGKNKQRESVDFSKEEEKYKFKEIDVFGTYGDPKMYEKPVYEGVTGGKVYMKDYQNEMQGKKDLSLNMGNFEGYKYGGLSFFNFGKKEKSARETLGFNS